MKDFISAKGAGREPCKSSARGKTAALMAGILLAAVLGGALLWKGGTAPSPVIQEGPAKKSAPGKSRVLPRAAPSGIRPSAHNRIGDAESGRLADGRNMVKTPPPADDIVSKTRRELDELAKLRPRVKDPDSIEALDRKQKYLEQLLVDKKMQFYATNGPGAVHSTMKTSAEQVLDWVFNCPVGSSPIPIPDLPNYELDDLMKILDTPCAADEGDSEAILDRRQMVDAAKQELKRFVAEGGRPRDFLAHYHAILERSHEMYTDAQAKFDEMCREGNAEDAALFLKATNRLLAEKGIKPLEVDERRRRRLGLEDSSETETKGKEEK